MYELFPIGKMFRDKDECEMVLDKRYEKGLKYLELFSHVLVFYADEKEDKKILKEVVMEVITIECKKGKLRLKPYKHKVDSEIVFDIKPYFPCEDRVKESQGKYIMGDKYYNTNIEKISGEENKYRIESLGKIRKLNGTNYIEVENDIIFKKIKGYSHIKILWWFHRFDNEKYRRCVECDPPYENAPKTGVFASRSPVRPNPIAMTTAKIVKLEEVNRRIYINNTECFDGTPCIDICPYIDEIDCVQNFKVPEWLNHWPEWLDDRKDSVISGKIKYSCSGLETLIDQRKHFDNVITDENLWKQENNNVTNQCIKVNGARQNNLKGINCSIPYNKITAVVGVSGSGKSSLVYDTIYAECKRRMDSLSENEKGMKRPNVDNIAGAIPSIAISQKEIGKNSRSTVGTYSDIYDYLRIIFATVGIRHCPECGEAIIPMLEEEILGLFEKEENIEIFNLENVEVHGQTIAGKVKKALLQSFGALLAKINDNKPILFQTTQMCYHCNRLLFQLSPTTFNYSDLESMCPICNGYGEKAEVSSNSIIENPQLSILDGASTWWGKLRNFINNPNANWMKGEIIGLADKMGVDLEKKWCDFPSDFRQRAIYGWEGEKVYFEYDNKNNGRKGSVCRPVEGAYHSIERLYTEKNSVTLTSKFIKKEKCEYCNGERLQTEGRMVSIGTKRFPEVAKMSIHEIANWCKSLPNILGQTNFDTIKSNARKLYNIAVRAEQLGVEYLELDRKITTLSGGEQQRLKLLAGLNNSISGVLYVLDEPSKGLHPKDYDKISNIIYTLRDSGNTVLMVEHNEDMISIADHIIEVGPSAGDEGGYLVGEGSLREMLSHNATQISKYMSNHVKMQLYSRKNIDDVKWVRVCGAKCNNLKNFEVSFPINAITCVCGVSGSGKTSLVKGVIYQDISKEIAGNHEMEFCDSIENSDVFKEVIIVDQTSLRRTPRSVPATYIEIMDRIRKLFAETSDAKQNEMNVNSFSFNSKQGQCQNCNGDGQIVPKFSEDSWITCPVCKGKRYKKTILAIKYKNKNISDILEMSVEQAISFFKDTDEIIVVLDTLVEVGLGYLILGQSSSTLSGGEASRLKLAKELTSKREGKKLYLIDEPTNGLHFSDIANLIYLFQKLIDEGDTIIIIEHNKHVLNNCDWIIELGPKAGKEGGCVIREEKV